MLEATIGPGAGADPDAGHRCSTCSTATSSSTSSPQQKYQGKPLADRLGGWLKQGEVFRGKEMACYHKEWAYFSQRFKVACADYIEAKPGIPPTPGHVQEVIALMRERKIPVLFASNYFAGTRSSRWRERTGAKAVIVPRTPTARPG